MNHDVTVIVPVMRRPLNAAPFVESLMASTNRAVVAVVADEDDNDTWRAWLQELVRGRGRVFRSSWPDPGGTFAQKVNLGYRMAPLTPWIFVCGDDVRFTPGWLEAALLTGQSVVGTCAPGTGVSDTFSPHLLISRTYVASLGASWDGPGVVCHEGYRHNYVDNEITAVARQRGMWAMAWDSIVEHHHPFYGPAADDPVYRLGQASVDADAMLWTQRRTRYMAAA